MTRCMCSACRCSSSPACSSSGRSATTSTGATPRAWRCGRKVRAMSDAVAAVPFRPALAHAAADAAPVYNEAIVKKCVIAAMFWGLVAFLVGVYIATELAWPQFNLGLSYVNFGRLRPVHTSAAIFAFGGSALIGTSFHVVQRTSRTRLFGGDALANFIFWGYQFFIVMAALSYVMGFSQSKEYAEPEWHIDLWLTIVWVCYA